MNEQGRMSGWGDEWGSMRKKGWINEDHGVRNDEMKERGGEMEGGKKEGGGRWKGGRGGLMKGGVRGYTSFFRLSSLMCIS